uniref:Uncharacterized protein n=1 Tax=Astyanax mexicanus TaxID=7994 RepID=A0A8B9KD99_ASTMX
RQKRDELKMTMATSPQKQTVKNRSKSTDEVQQAKKVMIDIYHYQCTVCACAKQITQHWIVVYCLPDLAFEQYCYTGYHN